MEGTDELLKILELDKYKRLFTIKHINMMIDVLDKAREEKVDIDDIILVLLYLKNEKMIRRKK